MVSRMDPMLTRSALMIKKPKFEKTSLLFLKKSRASRKASEANRLSRSGVTASRRLTKVTSSGSRPSSFSEDILFSTQKLSRSSRGYESFAEVFADSGQNLFLILIQRKPTQQADNDDEKTQTGQDESTKPARSETHGKLLFFCHFDENPGQQAENQEDREPICNQTAIGNRCGSFLCGWGPIDHQPLLPDLIHCLWCNGGHGLHQCGLKQGPVIPNPDTQIRQVGISDTAPHRKFAGR